MPLVMWGMRLRSLLIGICNTKFMQQPQLVGCVRSETLNNHPRTASDAPYNSGNNIMTENPNQPREYDAVKGGESQVPLGAAVLGGIPGVKSRLASPAVEVRITALSEAIKYGEAGLDLIIGALQDESIKLKFAAYSLLKYQKQPNIKGQFHNYLPTFDFDVITVDAEGKENSRRDYAHFFPEELGKGVGLEMVYIPGGTFMMGSPETAKERNENESPQHQVTVPAFYAGKYPIT